jgi:hypothetical protein
LEGSAADILIDGNGYCIRLGNVIYKKEQTEMSNSKILLTYKDDDGSYKIESVWATKEGNYYRINNIPFFATNVALNDLVSADENDGALYFDTLIEPSGHSVVQMIIFDDKEVIQVGKELEQIGCTWEGSHLKNLISIDIPNEISYAAVKQSLDKGEKDGRWSYKEACLSHKS